MPKPKGTGPQVKVLEPLQTQAEPLQALPERPLRHPEARRGQK